MTRVAALHKLLCSLFAADELRRFIVAGRDGDDLALQLPDISVSRAQLVDGVIAALERRELIDCEFFAELERARDRRAQEIQAVRTMWVSEVAAGTDVSGPPRTAGVAPSADGVASALDYYGEIEPSAEYYALSLTVDERGQAVHQTQTRWVGWANGKPGVELREPSRIDPQRMIANWKDIGQAPVAVVNNDSQFLWYVLHLGGNAIVRKVVLAKWIPGLFRAQDSVQIGLGAGFSANAGDVEASIRPTPVPMQRMDVLRRDGYHCRICGRTDEAHGPDLDVSHIRSFDQGGPTLPWNLITLCKRCREGITAADHGHLHRKAEDWLARLTGQTPEYWDGVRRWRAFVRAKIASNKGTK